MRSKQTKSRHFALLLYPDNELHMTIYNDILCEDQRDYEFIGCWHNGFDGGKKHLHLYLAFQNPRYQESVADSLGFYDSQFCRALFGKFSDSLLYLIHANSPEKEQYEPQSVFGSPGLLKKFNRYYMRFLRSDLDMSDAVSGCIDWIQSQNCKITYIAFARWAVSSPYFKGVSHPLCRMVLDEHNALYACLDASEGGCV